MFRFKPLKLLIMLACALAPSWAIACPETTYKLSNGDAQLILTEKQCVSSMDYYISGPGGTAFLGSAQTTTFSNDPSGVIPPGYRQVVWNDIVLSGKLIARWGLASSGTNGFYGVLSIFQNGQIQGVFSGVL